MQLTSAIKSVHNWDFPLILTSRQTRAFVGGAWATWYHRTPREVVFFTYSATPWTHSISAQRVRKLTNTTDLWVVILLDIHPVSYWKTDSESCVVFSTLLNKYLHILLSFALRFPTKSNFSVTTETLNTTHSDRLWLNSSHINLFEIRCSATEHLYMTGNHMVTKHLHNKLIYCSTMWQ